jgi:hypothetical protein
VVGTKEAMMAVQDLEGYEEAMESFLELMHPETRLAGLTPEQVARALAALPDELRQRASTRHVLG